MTLRPSVSVITPVYNGVEHLEDVIKSVAFQKMVIDEHLIIDDGSTDGTAECVSRFQDHYENIRYIYQPRQGAGAARNLGIEAAVGRYITFLDCDDLWLPNKLKEQISFMHGEGVTFSYGDYERCDRRSGAALSIARTPECVSYRDLLYGCPIGCLTAAYDQQVLGKVYMPDVKRGQDWGLWLALARQGGPARKYPGVHAIYRTGGNSLSTNKLAKLRDIYRIYRTQEGLDPLRSGWFLMHHAINALRK